jgi:transcriptional regulator GlxA family with amidase domain
LRLIRETACRDVHADAVASQMGYSRVTLDNRFKKAIGRTADAEIRRVRIAKATELLARSDLPLPAVAREAGFADAQYLSAVIRKVTGRTPMQYRREHKIRPAPRIVRLS